jgi:plasmid maintenance system antidote protein VapI
MAGAVPVTDNSGSLTVDAAAASFANNQAQVSGTAVSVNSGAKDAGTQRVILASDQTVVPVSDNAGSLTVDAPVGTPVFTRLSDGTAALTTSSGRLAVDASGVAVPITDNAGSLTVDNGGTFATQESQLIADNAGFTDGTSKVYPVGLIFDEVAGTALTENDVATPRIDSKRSQVFALEDATTRGQRAAVSAAGAVKVDNSANTQPVSGTVSITANSAVNVAQVAGTTTDTNSGVKSAGTQRVVLATDQPQLTNALKVDGSAVTQPVSGTVSITANSAVNTAQVAGTTTAVNAGTNSAGVQRVTLATDQTTLTNTLGNVGAVPITTGGLSIFHLVSAATTNLTNVKASAGQLYGWYIYNSNAAARKVAFHNTAGTPTAGASMSFAIVIPPSSAANVEFTTGIAFATGIGISTVTDLTDAGTTAVARTTSSSTSSTSRWYPSR